MLTPCPRCHRHVRAEERCPFCPSPSATSPSATSPSATSPSATSQRTAGLALALPLAVGLAASGCGGGVTTLETREPGSNTNGDERPPPREEELYRTAPAYGAAPLPTPAPPVTPAAPPPSPPPSPPTERDDDPRPAAAYGAPPLPTPPGGSRPKP